MRLPLHESLILLGRVDAVEVCFADGDSDLEAMLEDAELLKLFNLFQWGLRQRDVRRKKLAPIHVKADMLQRAKGVFGSSICRIALQRDQRAREIQRAILLIDDNFHNVGVCRIFCLRKR